MPDPHSDSASRPDAPAPVAGPGSDGADVTRLLAAASAGDPAALARALPLIYEDLRRQADRFLRRERADHTLQATALVHEAWVRLAGQSEATFENRGHFFAIAATAMRRILVSHARERGRLKRGGKRPRVELDESALVSAEPDVDLPALDDALNRLSQLDERLARTVELRFFGGLSVDETATALGVSTPTVKRDWALARAWLKRELESEDVNGVDDVARQ